MEFKFKNSIGETTNIIKEGENSYFIEDDLRQMHFTEKEFRKFIDVLIKANNYELKTPVYSLWQGDHGTIVSKLSTESDLPRIHVGGGGRVEKFKRIGPHFKLDEKTGLFKKVRI